MSLAVSVVLSVAGVIAVVGLLGYLLDRSVP